MQLTAEIVYGLVQGVLQARFDNPQPTPAFHMDLWRLCCSDNKYVAAAAPRGHAKSTSVTHSYTLAAALFRIKKHVVIVSDTEGQAAEFLKDIKTELLENEELIDLFAVKRLIKDTETEIIAEIGEDRHQFRILAKGAGQKIRGRKWRNTRPDLIVIDDLENDEMMLNQERREKLRKWLFSAVMPSLGPTGQVRMVGTIMHFDSILERLMPKADPERGVNLIVTPLAEYTDEKKPIWKSVRFRAHDEDFSNILWPEKFSKETLLRERQNYIDQGFPEGYAQEYLNYPIDEGSAFFRKNDLLPMKDEQWNVSKIYYVGGDFAISRKQRADHTVFAIVGVDTEGNTTVEDVRRGRWDTHEIVDEIFSIYFRYKPECFFFEKGQIWLAVESVLLSEMKKRGVFFNYDTVLATQDKEVRARPLQYRIRAGALRFDHDAPWYADLEQELLRFPKGAHDDQVDALAHIFMQLQELGEAPTWRERQEAEDEYEREQWEDDLYDDYYGGMSPVTGY